MYIYLVGLFSNFSPIAKDLIAKQCCNENESLRIEMKIFLVPFKTDDISELSYLERKI